jgi:hypothetical protein
MDCRTLAVALLCTPALSAPALAQTTAAPPAITRTVVAATKLPTVVTVALHFSCPPALPTYSGMKR